MPPRSSSSARPRKTALPAVDERLIAPESRYELVDGKLRYVPPSDEPHGSRCSKVSSLLEAHVGDDYDVAADMLTRSSASSDVAPDASVFPRARDPETGGRKLEVLAFEVVATQTLADAGKKARKLIARGVRRVFAIDAERRRALEWSRATGSWEILATTAVIRDPSLAVPLRVSALVRATRTDDDVAEALLERKNRVLAGALEAARVEGEGIGEARGRAAGEVAGEARGKVDALLAIFAARGVDVPAAVERRLRATQDGRTLDAWIREAAKGAAPEALVKPHRAGRRR